MSFHHVQIYVSFIKDLIVKSLKISKASFKYVPSHKIV